MDADIAKKMQIENLTSHLHTHTHTHVHTHSHTLHTFRHVRTHTHTHIHTHSHIAMHTTFHSNSIDSLALRVVSYVINMLLAQTPDGQ